MYFTDGVGLSSPQVGVNKRVLVIDTSAGNDRSKQVALVNPVIVQESGEQKGPEGCLSFPGLFAEVKRPNIVKVKAQDVDGKDIEVEGSGLLARALHHEIDHLDGILFIERMKKSDRENIVKKMRKMSLPVRDKLLI
jgi:peptide deformylase